MHFLTKLPLILTSIIINGVNSQCASYNNYCIYGYSPDDYAPFVAGYYEYSGVNAGCSYFRHSQLSSDFVDDIYIHWDTDYEKWYIGQDISTTNHYAWCSKSSLDSCTKGSWYVWDGTSTTIDYSVTIEHCNYDNTQCLALYNNTFSKTQHDTDDFCVRKTSHREFNVGVAGRYSISGCAEEKPYYIADAGLPIEGRDDSMITIAWDNELNVWQMAYSYDVTATWIAYCKFANLKTCSNNWYIYDGTDTVLDTQVVSGLCNTCTDTKYDTYCIYGGVRKEAYEHIVGIYEYDGCYDLMHAYKHTPRINESLSQDLILHYHAVYNHWDIDIGYGSVPISIVSCLNQDDIMKCSGNWSRWNGSAFDLQETIQSGSCGIIYDQCPSDNDENSRYLCIYEEDNDVFAINNEWYYPYIAGEYEYFDCDDQGFPQYLRIRDNDGNYLNETWENQTMISFDELFNAFSIHKINDSDDIVENGYVAYCRSLLFDLCDTFWNIYDNSTAPGHWAPAPSIRISKGGCNYETVGKQSFIEFIKDHLLYVVIGVIFLILCCLFCCLIWFCCKKTKKTQKDKVEKEKEKIERHHYNQKVPNLSPISAHHQIIPSTSAAAQTPTTPITPQYNQLIPPPQYNQPPPPYQNRKPSKPKQEPVTTEPVPTEPPPYNPTYDPTERQKVTNYIYAVPKQQSIYIFETNQGFEFDTRINFDLSQSVAPEPPQNITINAVPVIIEKPIFNKQESLQIQQEFANTLEIEGDNLVTNDDNDLVDDANRNNAKSRKIRHLPLQEWELRIDPVSNMKLLYNRIEKKNYWPWKFPQIARSLGLDMPNKQIFDGNNNNNNNDDELEMVNTNNMNNNNNEMGEGKAFEHVTFADNDVALDVLMYNHSQYTNQ